MSEIKLTLLLIFFILVSSCNSIEIQNEALIGTWQLKEIVCDRTDTIPELDSLREYQNLFINNLQLRIDPDATYQLSLMAAVYTETGNGGIAKEDITHLEEHGIILDERKEILEWKPLFLVENGKRTSGLVYSSSKKVGDYRFGYDLGHKPMIKSIWSRFSVKGYRLFLEGTAPLCYYSSRTAWRSDDSPIVTLLIFEKE